MGKLIIIRGNSGSGKSTISEELRNSLDGKIALIGQDALRRTVLMETDSLENTDILGLIKQTVTYCLNHNYTVVIEGILSRYKYGVMLEELINYRETESYVFYLDVSLKETLVRHQTKPIASKVSEDKLREWFQEKNYLNTFNEVVIPESSSRENTLNLIIETTGL